VKLDSINREQRLYVMPSGNGYSCYGFDVLHRKLNALAAEMGVPVVSKRKGTKKQFFEYSKLLDAAYARFKATGKKIECELHKPFIGLEGKRVEVVQTDGGTRRFYIGKSTGWMPCHLEVHNSRSIGGIQVMEFNIKSFRIVR